MAKEPGDPCPLDHAYDNPERWNPEGPPSAKRSHWMIKNIAFCFQLHDDVRVLYGLAHVKDTSFFGHLKAIRQRIDHRLAEMENGRATREPSQREV